MTDEQRQTAVSEQARCAVETVAQQIHHPADGDSVMLGTHRMWLLIGRAGGGSRTALAALAASFAQESKAIVSAYPAAAAIGALGCGWALVRAGQHLQADEAFAAIPALEGVAGIISCLGKSGRAMAMALANEQQRAEEHLAAAQEIARAAQKPEPSLLGWLDFIEALILYRRGQYPLVIDKLAPCLRAFQSKVVSRLRDFPGFEAEALLLQAKTWRELALYAQALEAAQDDVELRDQNGDPQGLVWALLEEARIHRFMGNLKDAQRRLGRAGRLLAAGKLVDLLACIEDQLGDVARAEGKPADAEQHYLVADRLARQADSPELQGHVANSRARLLEDQNHAEEALELLRQHEPTWQGSKGLGKYLYLKGSLHFRVGDEAEAARLITRAIGLLQNCGMQSYEALAHSRLAEVLLKQGKKDAACREWTAALRIAPQVQAEAFMRKLRERINELRAEDLVEAVAQLVADRDRLQTEAERARASARNAADRSFNERALLAHWFIRPLSAQLREAGKPGEPPPPVLREFSRILDNAAWFGQEFARSPASPSEAVEVCSLIKRLLEGAGDLGPDFAVALPDVPVVVRSHPLFLGQALLALFRGARSAFGTRQIRLLPPEPGVGATCILRFTIERPAPVGFEHAPLLVPLDSVGDDPKLAEFFQRGYTGDFTLLDFLVGVALWGQLKFETDTGSISLVLPRPGEKGVET